MIPSYGLGISPGGAGGPTIIVGGDLTADIATPRLSADIDTALTANINTPMLSTDLDTALSAFTQSPHLSAEVS